MHRYRTHDCGSLRLEDSGKQAKLSGWIHRKRDHGNLVFIDLRDQFGLTQCVIDTSSDVFSVVENIRLESVICVVGQILERSEETVNEKLPTGNVELHIAAIEVLSASEVLPIQVYGSSDYPEELRLRYRYLDLRREKMKKNILLRSNVIASIRRRMIDSGFTEFQTPILTASSPEGARDFLVPSRVHPGKFYALPQAPQIFKQLIMVSGFDRYFQIAPCFRDEDGRADRSPGEFYQLDLEMAFVTQEDVFQALEPIITGLFEEFRGTRTVSSAKWERIPYKKAMRLYGTDKPDLRNPLVISDVTEYFEGSSFGLFAKNIEKGFVVKAVPGPRASDKPRSFFDKLNEWARSEGAGGLGYIIYDEEGIAKGPIAKNLDENTVNEIKKCCGISAGDSIFFICDKLKVAEKFSGLVRTKVCTELGLLELESYKLCWIVDYPMYERDENTGVIDFSHNPFSMPQGGLEALLEDDPLNVLAYQYDIVCNGVELCSGAIRNHRPDIMKRAFAIAGYEESELENRFGGMLNAFQFGAPPHGGAAPGIDRIVMLLADTLNIREVTLFPMNNQAEDLLLQAPNVVDEKQVVDLHIEINLPSEDSLS
ncbi:MAG: aspartate--tRNA ligase [Rhodospirillaceae bacterium]|nr:aspartate--tRNA ligase [Rhodospirillaceae bacterium]